MTRHRIATLAVVVVAIAGIGGFAATASAFPPGQGPGGPILVVTDPGDAFGSYYAEILTAEGLNAFEVRSAGEISTATLSRYSVVIVAPVALTASQAAALSNWVQGGGNLIAMRPDAALAGLLGLAGPGGTLDDGYIRMRTASGPAAGLTADTMQFHGRAVRWTPAGAATIADLYSGPATASANPAVTLRSVGSAGGQAAAFTYDLARSVVLTRQGNPAWVGQERDGTAPIRSDDLFFPDWVNLDKVAIPQADEQQRLLANLVTHMSADRLPMPRLWYLPRGERAAVVMTGDDHTVDGTVAHFDRYLAVSPAGCSVADWQCVRSTSYVYPGNGMTDAQVAAYEAQGFEIGVHIDTGCADFTESSLRENWVAQRTHLMSRWPSLDAPRTNRTHCIVWTDWAGEPRIAREFGVRLDTNYYYWPGSWIQNRPGMFTGSGIPMRFADIDGSLIDVYQAATQLTDESQLDIPAHIAALLDRALGPQGFYGAFTANMHTDQPLTLGANAIVAAAQARGVPVVSAEQMLDWLDGRNNSSFSRLSYADGRLHFTVQPAAGARGLEAMVPATTPAGRLVALTRNGVPVATASRMVKGIEYLVFPAAAGDYEATYPLSRPGGVPSRSPGATGPGGSAADTLAPRVRVRPRRVRASRRGVVALRVRCPRNEQGCRVRLRLRRRGVTLAAATLSVPGGTTRRAPLRLTRDARALLRTGALTAVAIATARDTAGNRGTSRTPIRLLPPRRR